MIQWWCLQAETKVGILCVYYIEQLVRHSQPELKEKKVKKKLLQHLHPLTKVLTDLEVDLRTNTDEELVMIHHVILVTWAILYSWLPTFVASPNHGHVALINLLKDLVQNPDTIQRKNHQKYSLLDRGMVGRTLSMLWCHYAVFIQTEIYNCLLCVKALMGHRVGPLSFFSFYEFLYSLTGRL